MNGIRATIRRLISRVRRREERKQAAFTLEVSRIAREFEAEGDETVARSLMELITDPCARRTADK